MVRSNSWHIQAVSGLFIAAALSGCAVRNVGPALRPAESVTEQFPAAVEQRTLADYRLGPFDEIDVDVFQEDDLSVDGIRIDTAGRINLPLVGEVTAAGKTATELSRELEQLYLGRYLVRPQITVQVASSTTQKVAVQGQVRTPGVYPLNGPSTLLETISLAQGETEVAKLSEVVIFRTINGQRMGALFDVERIRLGEFADPAILGGDVVIVGYSNARGLWRDILRAAPLLNVFRPVDGFEAVF